MLSALLTFNREFDTLSTAEYHAFCQSMSADRKMVKAAIGQLLISEQLQAKHDKDVMSHKKSIDKAFQNIMHKRRREPTTKAAQITSFEEIPNQLIAEILPYADLPLFPSYLTVSRKWYEVLTQYPKTITRAASLDNKIKLCLSNYGYKYDIFARIYAFKKQFAGLQRLCCRAKTMIEYGADMFDNFGQLRALHILSEPKSRNQSMLWQFSNVFAHALRSKDIRSLTISDERSGINEHTFWRCINYYQKLERLELRRIFLAKETTAFSKCKWVLSIPSNFGQNIKELVLMSVDRRVACSLLAVCPALQSLQLHSSVNLDLANVANLTFNNLHTLTYIMSCGHSLSNNTQDCIHKILESASIFIFNITNGNLSQAAEIASFRFMVHFLSNKTGVTVTVRTAQQLRAIEYALEHISDGNVEAYPSEVRIRCLEGDEINYVDTLYSLYYLMTLLEDKKSRIDIEFSNCNTMVALKKTIETDPYRLPNIIIESKEKEGIPKMCIFSNGPAVENED